MRSPICLTAIPSASVSDISTWVGAPASSDRTAPGEASASTPMTRTPGRSAFTAVATPEIIPPPPTGTTIVVTSGTWFDDLKAHRPLAGHHRQVVEGVDQGEAFLSDETVDQRHPIGQRFAGLYDASPGRLRVRDLDERRRVGHDDRAGDAEPRSVAGERLGVVACAGRDHPGFPLLRATGGAAG